LQGAVDVLQALRVAGTSIPAASSPTGAAIAFDRARGGFFGPSQGGTQGVRVAGTWVPAASSPAGAAIAFDRARVAFFGHSQGSTSGELALAWTGAAPGAGFSGAGSHLTSSLLDKTMPVNIGAGMTYLIGEKLDAEHPVMTLFQSFFDR